MVEEEEPAAPAAAEKSLFNVKLVSFDATAKAKIIKEVKALLGLSLVDSKKFVEVCLLLVLGLRVWVRGGCADRNV